MSAILVWAGCVNFHKRCIVVTGWKGRDQSNQVVVDRTLGSFDYGMRKRVVENV